MAKICLFCGKKLFHEKKEFCDHICKEKYETKLKNCEVCGKQFFVRNKHRKRCDICQAKHDRERWLKNKERNACNA